MQKWLFPLTLCHVCQNNHTIFDCAALATRYSGLVVFVHVEVMKPLNESSYLCFNIIKTSFHLNDWEYTVRLVLISFFHSFTDGKIFSFDRWDHLRQKEIWWVILSHCAHVEHSAAWWYCVSSQWEGPEFISHWDLCEEFACSPRACVSFLLQSMCVSFSQITWSRSQQRRGGSRRRRKRLVRSRSALPSS